MRIHNGGATVAMPPGKGSNDRGVTMDEVARAAGVSQATVSRVVNGNPRVNSDAKRQVERAIERLGFVPNVAARSLVTRRSDSIGVVITEPATRVFGDPFFAQVLRGVSAALTARRQKLVLFLPQDPTEERRSRAVPAGRPRRRRDHVLAPRRRPAAGPAPQTRHPGRRRRPPARSGRP